MRAVSWKKRKKKGKNIRWQKSSIPFHLRRARARIVTQARQAAAPPPRVSIAVVSSRDCASRARARASAYFNYDYAVSVQKEIYTIHYTRNVKAAFSIRRANDSAG